MEQLRSGGDSSQAGAKVEPARGGLLNYILGVLTTLLVVGGMQFWLHKPDPPAIALHPPPTAAPTATPGPTPTPLPTATLPPLTVYVSGAVQKPGLYQLAAGARLGDALALAGGLAANANDALVNQAELLFDGAHLYIPEVGAAPAAEAPVAVLSGAPRAGPVGNPAGEGNTGGLVNLNTATLEQLDSLPGVGPSKAQAIVENRPYASADDLERVPGIGASTIEQLRPLVTVQ